MAAKDIDKRIAATPEGMARPFDGLTRAELLALPVVIDITTAARALGLGRSTGYELARRGEFPCRVLRIGSSYRVPTADLLRVLGIESGEQPGPSAA
jgi:excisionase family DNA binding protein